MSQIGHIEFYEDDSAKHEWRWRFVAPNNEIIAVSSEGYGNREDCEAGLVSMVEAVKGGCRVVELSREGGETWGGLVALVEKHRES